MNNQIPKKIDTGIEALVEDIKILYGSFFLAISFLCSL